MMQATTGDKSIRMAAAIVIDSGNEWIMQLRDNVDGVVWPGKISMWGGAAEVEDEGSFVKVALRELKEELGLLPEDIELLPISSKNNISVRADREQPLLHLKIFVAKLLTYRALHVYEGAGMVRIEKAGFPENTSEQNFAPYALETLHKLHSMSLRDEY